MSIPALTEVLPATIGDRRIALELFWPRHGRVRVWLTQDRDFALSADAVVQLLDITTEDVFDRFPITWMWQWTPPLTSGILTAYLWSREVVLQVTQLASDRTLAADFVSWLTGEHAELSTSWEERLHEALPQPRAPRTGERELELQAAADELSTILGFKLTRTRLIAALEELQWISRPIDGERGWKPSLFARATRLAYSRTVMLPGKAGSYEQCFLTEDGLARVRAFFEDPGASAREHDAPEES